MPCKRCERWFCDLHSQWTDELQTENLCVGCLRRERPDEARACLALLSGRRHRVQGGIAYWEGKDYIGLGPSACSTVRAAATPHLGRESQLVVPGRGILKVLNGDIVAIDNTGWPILVSGAAIGYAGSQWHKV